jgi:hypothetical protein
MLMEFWIAKSAIAEKSSKMQLQWFLILPWCCFGDIVLRNLYMTIELRKLGFDLPKPQLDIAS